MPEKRFPGKKSHVKTYSEKKYPFIKSYRYYYEKHNIILFIICMLYVGIGLFYKLHEK